MRFRFTIRDLLWLTLVVQFSLRLLSLLMLPIALILGWTAEVSRMDREARELERNRMQYVLSLDWQKYGSLNGYADAIREKIEVLQDRLKAFDEKNKLLAVWF